MKTILKIIALDLLLVFGWHVLARLLNWVTEVLILDYFTMVTLLGTPLVVPLAISFLNFVELRTASSSRRGQIIGITMLFTCVLLSNAADRSYHGSWDAPGIEIVDISLYGGLVICVLLSYVVSNSRLTLKNT